ncbi:hypothetical protein BUALT_Bualt04G0031300 [Buddleja alternifolia]|uniref:J domain-containing protein n=1 Tax=Buddleja alternifolia TaxID=168488 RepID=A0AAV6XWI6_9LAMI|nr:hypothetical protein BUALT_Bualt04G0031300 [Buddleja alternifolia]
MGKRKYRRRQEKPKPETRRLLAAAEHSLRLRNFADCQNYAIQAKNSDPTHPDSTRILAIVSVLICPNITSTLPDLYAVLEIPRYESDVARIRSCFENLTSVLNPNVNPYPLSCEAFDVVVKAWSVLSDPIEKVRFDEELRRVSGGCTPGRDGGTFWTMCPYCYYVYEYVNVYEECCLRCANGGCRRGFHAVAIGAPPPPEVAEKGKYMCPGFRPFMSGENNGGGDVENLWVPFPIQMGCHFTGDLNGDGFIIDMADDNVNAAGVEETEEMDFEVHDDSKEWKIKGEGNNNDELKNVNVEKSESIGENNGGSMKNSVKEGAERERRKKHVPLNSKKLTGRGLRIDMDVALPTHGVGEEEYLNVDGNEELEPVFGGDTNNDIESEVDFFEGIDDILVRLQCDSDLGYGCL